MGLKIKKIEKLDYKEKAYDLTVDSKTHTFMLENGVFVHNSLKVPKQYIGDTTDDGGFDGGTSLSLISSRYAKTIKRIQNVLVQMVTDLINILLVAKGYSSYINKFRLRMQEPTTREEADRKDAMINKITVVQDTMSLFDDIQDPVARLTILKNLLAGVSTDAEILAVIEDSIAKAAEDAEKEAELQSGEEGKDFGDLSLPGEDSGGFRAEPSGGGLGDFDLGGSDFGGEPGSDDLGGSELPTPEALGQDFVNM